jgi:hypothetical protein
MLDKIHSSNKMSAEWRRTELKLLEKVILEERRRRPPRPIRGRARVHGMIGRARGMIRRLQKDQAIKGKR